MAYLPEVWANHPGTSLSAAISSATRPVTFTVASATGLPSSGNFRVIIDNEILLITTISGTSLTGSNTEGTTAATHSSGATVTEILTSGSLTQLEIDVNNGVGAAPNVVTFSGTPTFDFSLSRAQKITLTGNVTAPVFSNITAGQRITLLLVQDATGGRSFAWPSGIHGAPVISTAAGTATASTAALVSFICYTTAVSGMYLDGIPQVNQ